MSVTATALKLPGATLPRSVPKAARPTSEARIFTPSDVTHMITHNRPEFQRPLNLNPDVIEAARDMMREAHGDKERMCTIEGTIEFGRYKGVDYLLDGQHRLFGAYALAAGIKKLEGTTELVTEDGSQPLFALANVMITPYESMAEMADAFVKLNKKLAPLKPDDLLRGRESSNAYLREIREECPFIGYEKNRFTKATTMISMSAAIRTWFGSGATPSSGPNADRAAALLDEVQTERIVAFFRACAAAGWVNTDRMNERLWGTLNIGINMWLFRKFVYGTANKIKGTRGATALSASQYAECMKDLRNPDYFKFLGSRSLRFQDRRPTYDYVKELFEGGLMRCQIVGAEFPEPQGW